VIEEAYKLTTDDIDYAYKIKDELKTPLYFIVQVVWGISYDQFKNRKKTLRLQRERDAADNRMDDMRLDSQTDSKYY
tara:strand:- start:119 stop:349 length:231 start_codon:yes stop_codon:yes gene_type:complete